MLRTITCVVEHISRTAASTSRPEPSGSLRSRITTSNVVEQTAARASATFALVATPVLV
jgi:hypothetical protein